MAYFFPQSTMWRLWRHPASDLPLTWRMGISRAQWVSLNTIDAMNNTRRANYLYSISAYPLILSEDVLLSARWSFIAQGLHEFNRKLYHGGPPSASSNGSSAVLRVELRASDGQTNVINVEKEVILSASAHLRRFIIAFKAVGQRTCRLSPLRHHHEGPQYCLHLRAIGEDYFIWSGMLTILHYFFN